MSTLTSQTTSPISLQRAKTHLRVQAKELDREVDSKLNAALDYVERVTGRSIRVDQTYEEWFSRWCNPFPFQTMPIKSVTSIEYYVDDVLTLLAATDYRLDDSQHGRNFLRFVDTFTSPTHDTRHDAIKLTYVAGWASVGDIPPTVIEAVLTQLSIMWGDLRPNEQAAYERVFDSQCASLQWGYS